MTSIIVLTSSIYMYPCLRERIDDLPELAQTILTRIAIDSGKEEILLDSTAIEALSQYQFPGNVRELENILERALALSDGDEITADDFQLSSATNNAETANPIESEDSDANIDAQSDLEGYLEDVERTILSSALEESRWNKTATAKTLGISFRSLRYRLKKLGLDE